MVKVVGILFLIAGLVFATDREVSPLDVELNFFRIYSKHSNAEVVFLLILVYPGLNGGTAKISRSEDSSEELE